MDAMTAPRALAEAEGTTPERAREGRRKAAPRKPRVAIVLFNLGGPDKPESVKPFLYNLFADPAIIRVPAPFRQLLAWIITWRRTPIAAENYAVLGGKSPLLELTEEQAGALARELSGELDVRAFVCMRYWHPMSDETARAVRAWGPDEVVLVPLYPQFSTTTTGSSLDAWRDAAARAGLVAPTRTLCCYHSDPGFISATAAMVRESYEKARAELAPEAPLRVLFSAHGLPESIVTRGDPYQWQVERTVEGVVEALAIDGLDHVVCYQSRVTPQKWIGPSTEEELKRAGADKTAVLVVPIAFVSEHSETLVELDVEYREEAEEFGVPGYFRTPAQNSDKGFIAALADLVRHARAEERSLCSFRGPRTCPRASKDCPHASRGFATAGRVAAAADED
ncbi:ferrochelatase [Elioraea rosea]|uniref:ferrochelatase n=1 Tax=Elioraea rosea TaxID=2492390 RepID=UPI001EF4EF41|nr:ferrochelatase [Elioraea rosea]